MILNCHLSVRECLVDDIKLISDYWQSCSEEYLLGMGADIKKRPSEETFIQFLRNQSLLSFEEKEAYALIWEMDNIPIGHSNINKIIFGKEAYMHLHLWNSNVRLKGMGTQLVKLSIPFYFKNFDLQILYCEPYALNPAPNKTMEKVGFKFEKRHKIIPGAINFEQEVNTWLFTRSNYLKLE